MPFNRNKFLLGFVVIAAVIVLAGTLGAANDKLVRDKMPDYNDDMELFNWLCAHSEEILQNMRSYEPLLEEIEGYPKCLVDDAPMHQGDFWTVNKLDSSAFCIHRTPKGKLVDVWVTIDVYNDEGVLVKQIHVKMNPYTLEIIGMEVVDGPFAYPAPLKILNKEDH